MKTIKKILSITLTVSMLIMATVFPVNAASGTIYEAQDLGTNDTASGAEYTANDYDTYGMLSTSTDVDWWRVTFSQSGMANFYLRVPSGCNYNIHVYDNTGTVQIEQSTRTALGTADFVRCHVKAGCTYRVKIVSKQGYSNTDYYMFRTKNYVNRNSYLFTSSTTQIIGESPLSDHCSARIGGLGFSYVHDCPNNSVYDAYSVLPGSDICVIYESSTCAGIMSFYTFNSSGQRSTTFLVGKSFETMGNSTRAISNFSASQLSEVDLIIFAGSLTGNTGPLYGNLVDQAVAKGAFCALGWCSEVNSSDMLIWLDYYLFSCQTENAYLAMRTADRLIEHEYQSIDTTALEDRYWGNSSPNNLMLDVNYGT